MNGITSIQRKKMKEYGEWLFAKGNLNQPIFKENLVYNAQNLDKHNYYLREVTSNGKLIRRNSISNRNTFKHENNKTKQTINFTDNLPVIEPKTRLQTSKSKLKSNNVIHNMRNIETEEIQKNEIYPKNSSIPKNYNNFNKIQSKPMHYVSGLNNLGNTCYMNTSLQCLIHSQPFILGFLNEVSKLNNLNKNSTTFHFMEILKSVESNTRSYTPTQFKYFFSQKHTKFMGYAQQDSQEFLRHLLDDISLELNRVSIIPKYKELETKNKSKIQINKDFYELNLSREDSVVTDTFQGQLCNTFECEDCHFKTYSFEKFIDLPILLDVNIRSSVNLDTLLKSYFKEERFKWDSKCEKCKNKTFHSKKTSISMLPNILVISFQRYNYISNKKNNARINFSEKLGLKDFIDFECVNSSQKDKIYQLYSICNHSGNLNFGHYYAYCKVNDDWKEFNDSSVTNCNISNASDSVYVLFYEKI